MDNDIVFLAASYLGVRLAALAGFGYVLYQALQPARATIRSTVHARPRGASRADTVADDRC